jgi:hypothetical protein
MISPVSRRMRPYRRAGQHKIDASAAALRAFEPLDPRSHCQISAVALCHLSRVGLDLVAAIAAPDDQAKRKRPPLFPMLSPVIDAGSSCAHPRPACGADHRSRNLLRTTLLLRL